jgi:hypothetical protein
MARFAGDVRESFSLPVSAEAAAKHFADLETIAANYIGLHAHEIVDAQTIRFVLEAQSDKGITFQGRYTCVYTLESPTRLTWRTPSNDNMWSSGRAIFQPTGDASCRVEYTQRIESEIPVPKLLSKVVAPIVNRKIAEGVRDYIAAMRASLPRGA